eukprot:5175332-Amphidinium_carterae.1
MMPRDLPPFVQQVSHWEYVRWLVECQRPTHSAQVGLGADGFLPLAVRTIPERDLGHHRDARERCALNGSESA